MELNNIFDIHKLPDKQGVYEPLPKKIARLIDQLKKKRANIRKSLLASNLKVKITGDDTLYR